MLHEASFSEGRVAFVRDDEVIVERDPEDLAGFRELSGDLDVLLGGFRVAGGVVVGHDDRGGTGYDSAVEYFPRVNEGAVQRAFGDHLKAGDAVLGGEPKRDEAFPDLIDKEGAVEAVDVIGGAKSSGLEEAYFGEVFGGFLEPPDDGSEGVLHAVSKLWDKAGPFNFGDC